jgi:hypothetical protein
MDLAAAFAVDGIGIGDGMAHGMLRVTRNAGIPAVSKNQIQRNRVGSKDFLI